MKILYALFLLCLALGGLTVLIGGFLANSKTLQKANKGKG